MRHDRLDAAGGGQYSDLRPVKRAGALDNVRDQCILKAGAVAEIDDCQGIYVGKPGLPVMRVVCEHTALAWREALIDERSRAHRLGRTETDGSDVQVVPECC